MLVFYGLINSTLWAFWIKIDIEKGLTNGQSLCCYLILSYKLLPEWHVHIFQECPYEQTCYSTNDSTIDANPAEVILYLRLDKVDKFIGAKSA